MKTFYDFFNYDGGLSPEVYFKYIIFITLLACVSRLVGEMLNSVK